MFSKFSYDENVILYHKHEHELTLLLLVWLMILGNERVGVNVFFLVKLLCNVYALNYEK